MLIILNKRIFIQLFIITCLSFFIRLVFFFAYMHHEMHYQQSISSDYHICALGIHHGYGMHNIFTREPIFLRAPGYPYLVSLCYGSNNPSIRFKDFTKEHTLFLIIQIAVCSLLPALIYFLSYTINTSYLISIIAAFITMFHGGFIISSCVLTHDGLATIFFIVFLIFFFMHVNGLDKTDTEKNIFFIVCSAISLASYTWIQPHGEYIAFCSVPLLLFIARYIKHASWFYTLKGVSIFFIIFLAGISPWYIRNYTLTNTYFFCPSGSTYIHSFVTPYIMHNVLKKPLSECFNELVRKTQQEITDQNIIKKSLKSKNKLVKEYVCLYTALPWVLAYPFLAMRYWFMGCMHIMTDLYTSQLVVCEQKNHTYDSLEIRIVDRWYDCILNPRTSWYIRWVGCVEALFYICMLVGFFIYSIKHAMLILYTMAQPQGMHYVLLLMICISIGIAATSGLAHAFMRLPIEPLIYSLSLQFWIPFIQQRCNKYGSVICPVAV